MLAELLLYQQGGCRNKQNINEINKTKKLSVYSSNLVIIFHFPKANPALVGLVKLNHPAGPASVWDCSSGQISFYYLCNNKLIKVLLCVLQLLCPQV